MVAWSPPRRFPKAAAMINSFWKWRPKPAPESASRFGTAIARLTCVTDNLWSSRPGFAASAIFKTRASSTTKPSPPAALFTGCPVNSAAGGEGFVVELARVLKIADAANPGLELHKLSVTQVRRAIAVPKREADSGAGFGRHFQNELIIAAAFGKRRGGDHATIQEHTFSC